MDQKRAQAILRFAIEQNDPQLAVGALADTLRIAPAKVFRASDDKEVFETATRSTRSLVERARVLYTQPEHVAAIAHPQPRYRSAYDWLFLEDNNGVPLDLKVLVKLLSTPVPAKRISRRARFITWLDERQALVNDTLLLCELILNRMVFK